MVLLGYMGSGKSYALVPFSADNFRVASP
jgi:hypothetical protein